MFFERLKEVLEGSGDLLRAEAELAGKRARRMLVNSAAFALCGLIVLTGVGLGLGAVGVEFADRWGLSAALALIGGGLVIVGGLGIMIAKFTASTGSGAGGEEDSSDTRPPAVKAESAKEQIKDAVTPDRDDEDGEPASLHGLGNAAIEATMKNPLAAGSAALLVVALLGPRRTLRVVSKGIAAVGLATSLLDAITPHADDLADSGSPAPPERAEPPRNGARAAASGGPGSRGVGGRF